MATRVPVICCQMRCGGSSTIFYGADGVKVSGTSGGATLDGLSKTPFPIAGNVTELYVLMSTTTTGSGTSVITLVVNGSDSAATCTIAANGTSAQITGLSVAIAVGDILSIKIVNNSGATLRFYNVSYVFVPTTATERHILAPMTGFGTNNQYMSPVTPADASQSSFNLAATVMPCAGTIDKMIVRMSANIAAAKTMDCTLYVNGSATALTCQITAGNITNSDNSHSVSVNAGDTIAWIGTHTDAFPNVTMAVSCRFVPSGSRTGQPVWFGTSTNDPAGATRYCPTRLDVGNTSTIAATDPNDGTTAAPRGLIPGVFYSVALYVNQSTGSGASKTSTFTFRVNGSNSSQTCSTTGAGTGAGVNANNDVTHSITLALNDGIVAQWTETAGATANIGHIAVALSDVPPSNLANATGFMAS